MDVQETPVVVTRDEDGFTVAVVGPIHVNTAWIERELERVVAARPKLVKLDLGKCNHVSSLGLGILIAFRRGIVSGGGTVRTVAVHKHVFEVMRHAYLLELFDVKPSAVLSGP